MVQIRDNNDVFMFGVLPGEVELAVTRSRFLCLFWCSPVSPPVRLFVHQKYVFMNIYMRCSLSLSPLSPSCAWELGFFKCFPVKSVAQCRSLCRRGGGGNSHALRHRLFRSPFAAVVFLPQCVQKKEKITLLIDPCSYIYTSECPCVCLFVCVCVDVCGDVSSEDEQDKDEPRPINLTEQQPC